MSKHTKREMERLIREVLDVAQTDMDKIPGDERYIFVGRVFFAFGAFGKKLAGIHKREWVVNNEEWEEIREFVMEWRRALERIADLVKGGVHQIYYTAPISFGWSAGEFHTSSPAFDKDECVPARVYNKDSLLALFKQTKDRSDLPFDEFTMPPRFYNFFKKLEGYQADSLKRCLHCGRVFFNPTKFKKVYCSPNCRKAAAFQRSKQKKSGRAPAKKS